jgi:hypothetical protein
LPVLNGGQQFGLKMKRKIPNLIEKKAAFVGYFEFSGRLSRASVKAPFTCPKSSLSNRVSVIAPYRH